MKKNVMMRFASLLLVMVLLTSSVISGTFAKYVTAGSAKDTARVAKWGVSFEVETDSLFKTEYKYDKKPSGVTSSFSVESTDKVVAPGTSGDTFSFKTVHAAGSPEVSYVVEFNVDETFTRSIYVDGYYPVKYTLTLDGTPVVSEETDLPAVLTALENCKYMYDVDEQQYYICKDGSTFFKTASVPSLKLSWAWAFEQGKDVEDTLLGNLAAGVADPTGHTYDVTAAIKVDATATQID